MRPCNCGKDSHTYVGARQINKKMTFTARKKGKTARSQTPYKCPQGNGWHLTSHSYKKPTREAFTWLTKPLSP